jgi:hypothetical protein
MDIRGPYALVSICGRPYRHRRSAGLESLPPRTPVFQPGDSQDHHPVYQGDGTLDPFFAQVPVWQDEVRQMNAYKALEFAHILDLLGPSLNDPAQDVLPGLGEARATLQGVSLPTNRAFVLQFHAQADLRHWQWIGRVEHVRSADSARFGSLDELLDFLVKALNEHG